MSPGEKLEQLLVDWAKHVADSSTTLANFHELCGIKKPEVESRPAPEGEALECATFQGHSLQASSLAEADSPQQLGCIASVAVVGNTLL